MQDQDKSVSCITARPFQEALLEQQRTTFVSDHHMTPLCAHRFSEAIGAGRISKVEKIDDCCVLAAVGHQMASRKGVAATMFSALAKANINIRYTMRALYLSSSRILKDCLRTSGHQPCAPA